MCVVEAEWSKAQDNGASEPGSIPDQDLFLLLLFFIMNPVD